MTLPARVSRGGPRSAEEMAATTVWRATPGTSCVTGQVIVADGGRSVAEERS